MQKSRWIVLSLLALACSYHAEVSCMDALVIEMDAEKKEVIDEESPLVSHEHTSTQNSESEVHYRDRCKKCSRCLDDLKYLCKNCWNAPGCERCCKVTSFSAMGLAGLSVLGAMGYMMYLLSNLSPQ